MTVRSMRIARWIPKATYALTLCNTYFFPTVTMVARRRLNVALYVHCLYVINILVFGTYLEWESTKEI